MEKNVEEEIDIKRKYTIKNLKDPIIIREPASKNYVDTFFNNPSIIKNTAFVDFNYNALDDVRFVKVNSPPAVGEHLTAKKYVDQAIAISVDEPIFIRINQDNNFINLNFTNTNSVTLNTQAIHGSQVNT